MTTAELPDDFSTDIQGVFRKTPVLLIGSGFSCGYGLPGMGVLAEHLATSVHDVLTTDGARNAWAQSVEAIKANLEAGLNGIPVGMPEREEIVSAIRGETARLILDKTIKAEAKILDEKVAGNHAPSRLLRRLYDGSPQNAESIHVITTNYDTLLELFCDLAGLPLDTGFMGFRRRKPRLPSLFQTQYSRVLVPERRQQQVDHRICKTVRLYKPHGSISWLTTDEGPIEILNDVSVAERAIVVPGPSKYQDTLVNELFGAMRAEMKTVLNKAQALLCIGFGFNDDHLQDVIKRRVTEGMPIIIVTRSTTQNIEQLLHDHSHVIALFKSDEEGAVCHWNGNMLQSPEPLWQLDDFLKKFLE